VPVINLHLLYGKKANLQTVLAKGRLGVFEKRFGEKRDIRIIITLLIKRAYEDKIY
tara:strand:+ start:1477 stop:1644 length:168 start_codon:yes stop_codon:yes gene_type:complete